MTTESPRTDTEAVVTFIQATCVGFTNNDFGATFQEDVAEGCARRRRRRPEKLQAPAPMIVDAPDHKGAAKVLTRLAQLRTEDEGFRDIKIDAPKEFHEGRASRQLRIRTGGIRRNLPSRRTYTRPMPPDTAISTIHKAKGVP